MAVAGIHESFTGFRCPASRSATRNDVQALATRTVHGQRMQRLGAYERRQTLRPHADIGCNEPPNRCSATLMTETASTPTGSADVLACPTAISRGVFARYRLDDSPAPSVTVPWIIGKVGHEVAKLSRQGGIGPPFAFGANELRPWLESRLLEQRQQLGNWPPAHHDPELLSVPHPP
jgi:hypothetical protein